MEKKLLFIGRSNEKIINVSSDNCMHLNIIPLCGNFHIPVNTNLLGMFYSNHDIFSEYQNSHKWFEINNKT